MEPVVYAPDEVICNCKQVTLGDIDRALHNHATIRSCK